MTYNREENLKPHAEKVMEAVDSAQAAKSMIAASWARSVRKYGLAPDLHSKPIRHADVELLERRERLERLLQVSPASLERLFDTISLAGCGIFLCDGEGVILHSMTAAGDEADFSRAGLSTGCDWSERNQGTNGIGTCIAEGRAVNIHFDQHFNASNTAMSCMGAPIYGAEGELSAVLDISSCRNDLNAALLQLVSNVLNDTAGQIEAEHFCDAFAGTRILRGEGDKKRSPVLLAVDSDDLVIGATRAARKTYGLPLNSAFSPKPTSDLLGDQEKRGVGLDSAERREITRAIARADGNMTLTARSLGISRATLYRRMQRLGLTVQS